VQLAQVLLHLVDTKIGLAHDADTVAAEGHPGHLLDGLHALEVSGGVHQLVDLTQRYEGIVERVGALPRTVPLELALVRAQPVDGLQRAVTQALRETGELQELEAMGIDHPLQANQGHEPTADLTVLPGDPPVVEQQPYGQHRVEIGLVPVQTPLAPAQVETLEDHDHGLLTGREGEGAHTALMVIEVVDLALDVHERLTLGGAVQEDASFRILARRRRRDAETPVETHGDVGRLDAGEESSAVVLPNPVPDRKELLRRQDVAHPTRPDLLLGGGVRRALPEVGVSGWRAHRPIVHLPGEDFATV